MWSPTNAMLAGIAFANLVVNIDFIPFTYHTNIENDTLYSAKSSYFWAVVTLVHAHISVTFHSISSWLIVLLAVWRYISVSFPTESKSWCTMVNAQLTITAAYILIPIISIPLYLSFAIHEDMVFDGMLGRNKTVHLVSFSKLSLKNNGLLKDINFWVYSVMMKLVPCILLTYLSFALIQVVVKADKRRQQLKANHNNIILASSVHSLTTDTTSAGPGFIPLKNVRPVDMSGRKDSSGSARSPFPNTVGVNQSSPKTGRQRIKTMSSSSSQTDRTTKMLLTILIFFIVSEFPTGVVYLLIGLLGEEFQDSVYQPLGDIFDILALINASITFILLATMSRQFRKTFRKTFCSYSFCVRLASISKKSVSTKKGNNLIFKPRIPKVDNRFGDQEC